jgi:outer membrane protein
MKGNRMIWAALAAVVCMAVAMTAQAADGAKVGVVDLQRCLNDSKLGKQFKAEFTAEAEQLKADLEKEETELKALREEIEKQGLVLSETARKEREATYGKRLEAFKGRFKESQQALQRKDQELTRKVLKGLQGIIGELGDKGGYTLIVEKQEAGVLFMSQASDLTDEVVRRYDQNAGQE